MRLATLRRGRVSSCLSTPQSAAFAKIGIAAANDRTRLQGAGYRAYFGRVRGARARVRDFCDGPGSYRYVVRRAR